MFLPSCSSTDDFYHFPSTAAKRIGLSLSGGGIRAAIFHLGVIQWLAESNLLENIHHISTVSGASLAMALVYAKNNYKFPGSNTYLHQTLPLLRETLLTCDIQRSALQSLALSPWNMNRKANLLAKAIQTQWDIHGSMCDLPKHPLWSINCTTFETGKNFRISQEKMGDYKVGYVLRPTISIGDAAAASAGFPVLIGPYRLPLNQYVWTTRTRTKERAGTGADENEKERTRASTGIGTGISSGTGERAGTETGERTGTGKRAAGTWTGERAGTGISSSIGTVRELSAGTGEREKTGAKERAGAIHLWDGGVYDNLGLEVLYKISKGGHLTGDLTYLIVSNASAPSGCRRRDFFFSAGNLKRLLDITITQVAALRSRDVKDFFQRTGSGCFLNIGSKTEFMPGNTLTPDQIHFVKNYPTTLISPSPSDFDLILRHGYEVARTNIAITDG